MPALLEDHPLASLFPILPAADMKQLVESVGTFGLQHPIVLYEGKILDGRHRYQACLSAGANPHFTTYKGDDPLGLVLSANLHRRHLDTGQRAIIAAKLASMRQGERTDKYDTKEGFEPSANLHKVSLQKAADDADVSRRYAATAKKLIKEAPRLANQVSQGKISLHAAEKKLEEKNAASRPVQKDKIGREIPATILELWNHAEEEADKLRQWASNIRVSISRAQDNGDLAYVEVGTREKLDELTSHANFIYSKCAALIPHAVCPWCQGKKTKTCGECHGRGFVSRLFWLQNVGEDLKAIVLKTVANQK